MRNDKIEQLLKERIEADDFPSAVYLVAEKGEIVFHGATGLAVVEPERIEARNDTIYDLASMTKVLVTGLLCARFFSNEDLLSEKVSEYCNGFDKDGKQEITIKNLLTHTSGLKAWKPFYLGKNLWSEIFEEKLDYQPNSKVVYSDLNFILLSFIIEEIYQDSFENVAEKVIFNPLNLQNTFFNPPKELQKRIAASEFGNEFEKQMCIEKGYDISGYDWRDYQIWGEVHDGNCYFMNGVSGHAGLFSTAEETFKIARQFLAEETVLLKPETCELFRKNFTKGMNEVRSFAFQLAETQDSSASDALSKDSFGHLGFTGTSVWIEPETRRIFILLTNRTHNAKPPFVNINSTRRRFHEIAVAEFLNNR